MITIRLAETDDDIARCSPIMRQLRPHLLADEFVHTVRRQFLGGYRLALLEGAASVRAVAGFRLVENLAGGRVLYVDDLVTDAAARSQGHGEALLEWLRERAREEGCANLELDSGVQRSDAHRFYFANGMSISSYHFRQAL